MKSSLTICISFISFVFVSSYSRTHDDHFRNSKCYEAYIQQIIRVNTMYEDSLCACNDKDNINRRQPQELDINAEAEKHKQTSAEACSDFAACNLITDFNGFFNCHIKNAKKHENKFFIMHLNASSVAIELSDKYDPEQKEILRCQLAAKRNYVSVLSTIINKYLTCA